MILLKNKIALIYKATIGTFTTLMIIEQKIKINFLYTNESYIIIFSLRLQKFNWKMYVPKMYLKKTYGNINYKEQRMIYMTQLVTIESP